MRCRYIAVLLCVCAALTLFPPWVSTRSFPQTLTVYKPIGRAFVFFPPNIVEDDDPRWVGTEVDLKTLSVELLSVAFLVGAVRFGLPQGKNDRQSGDDA